MDNLKFKRLTLNNIDMIKEPIIIDDITYTIEMIKKFIQSEENYIFIGTINNKIIAFLYGYSLARPDGKNMFYIHSVDVIPGYQEKGIGTKLMDYVIDFIKSENKCYKFWVLADTDNVRACNLYKKYGDKIEQNLFSGAL
ncbi:MAG: GNAT family N-acetyltransferase [Clostridia bacterium]|nr:GNAT family N-acetyltransferase [Clostridia bacterium]